MPADKDREIIEAFKSPKKAYTQAMQKLFASLDATRMEAYLAEEARMQDLITRQNQTGDMQTQQTLALEYIDLMETSDFKELRLEVARMEKAFYDQEIDDFVDAFKRLF